MARRGALAMLAGVALVAALAFVAGTTLGLPQSGRPASSITELQ